MSPENGKEKEPQRMDSFQVGFKTAGRLQAEDVMIRITAPHFCAGVWLSWRGGEVTEAPPILSYMMGWSQNEVEEYCKKKGWEFEYD